MASPSDKRVVIVERSKALSAVVGFPPGVTVEIKMVNCVKQDVNGVT